MRLLDLCSGIGGFSLGLEWSGFETVAFCEWDEDCRKVLDKHWPEVPKYADVTELTKKRLDDDGIRNIRSICGGYPCQPFSLAGKREGAEDDRHIWPDIARLLREFINDGEPIEWCIFENVYGHISMGLDDVLVELEDLNYSWWAFVIPASAVGAIHERKRVWIIAHANSFRAKRLQHELGELGQVGQGGAVDEENCFNHVANANANGKRQSGSGRTIYPSRS
jgi:DNA (cytosine-5)-methyltransferase 1